MESKIRKEMEAKGYSEKEIITALNMAGLWVATLTENDEAISHFESKF